MAESGLSAAEKKALKDTMAERRKAAKRGSGSKKLEAELKDCLAAIKKLSKDDQAIGMMLHEIVTTHAPHLNPKTWYGMPAYAKDGKVIVFFKAASKFDVRYAEIGFNEHAQLDRGDIWPTAFAVRKVTEAIEKKITTLVKRAAR